MTLLVCVYCETVCQFESNERLGQIFVFRDEAHHLPSYFLSAGELCVC
jgi:hypothetical protein